MDVTAKGGVVLCLESAACRVPRGSIKVNRRISQRTRSCFQVELNQGKDEVAILVQLHKK
jgi:hypothetical protein